METTPNQGLELTPNSDYADRAAEYYKLSVLFKNTDNQIYRSLMDEMIKKNLINPSADTYIAFTDLIHQCVGVVENIKSPAFVKQQNTAINQVVKILKANPSAIKV